MLLGMRFARLGRMMGRVSHMALSDLGMVPGLFMIAGLISFGRFLVVVRRGLVMRCGRFVMLGGLGLRGHIYLRQVVSIIPCY
jgi:hypothetical protein